MNYTYHHMIVITDLRFTNVELGMTYIIEANSNAYNPIIRGHLMHHTIALLSELHIASNEECSNIMKELNNYFQNISPPEITKEYSNLYKIEINDNAFINFYIKLN